MRRARVRHAGQRVRLPRGRYFAVTVCSGSAGMQLAFSRRGDAAVTGERPATQAGNATVRVQRLRPKRAAMRLHAHEYTHAMDMREQHGRSGR